MTMLTKHHNDEWINNFEMDQEEFPDILKAVLEAISNLLPTKSKEKYEKCYKLFCQWRIIKKVQGIDEDILIAYFFEKAKTFKSSTLWSVYSMLKSTLQINENGDIPVYRKLIAYIKRQNEEYMAKESKVLTMDHVIMFLSKAPDDLFLFMKVVLIFALHGACRDDELRMLQVDNIEDNGSVLVVTLHDTKTKKKRVFTILSDVGGVNGIALYRTYLSLRPKSIGHRRFFVCCRRGKCTVQPVGINTFYSIPRKIAEYLQLPNASSYTGHCFRRTSATLLAESGADIQMLKRHGGWRSSTVDEGIVEESIENKINTTRRIFNGQHNVSRQPSSIGTSCVSSTVASSERASTSLSVSDFQSMVSSSGTTFNNLRNCTFVININKCNDNE